MISNPFILYISLHCQTRRCKGTSESFLSTFSISHVRHQSSLPSRFLYLAHMTTMSVNKPVSETNPVMYREVEQGTAACRKWLSGKGRTDPKLGWHSSYPSEKALLDHIFTNIRNNLINLHQGMAFGRNMKDREVRRVIGEVLSRELLLNGVTRIGKLLLIHSTSMSLTLRTALIPHPILQPFPGFTQSLGMLGPAGPGPQSQDRQHRLAYAQANGLQAWLLLSRKAKSL